MGPYTTSMERAYQESLVRQLMRQAWDAALASVPRLTDAEIDEAIALRFPDGFSSPNMSRLRAFARAIEALNPADAELNEADELLKKWGLDPDTYRTDGGAINHMKVRAALLYPDLYPHTAQAAPEPPEWNDFAVGWQKRYLETQAVRKAQGANDWKARALEAEETVRHLSAALRSEIEGPTLMGEPVIRKRIEWANLPAYLIDHCEGQEVSEENVQRWVSEMLIDPKYTPPQAAPEPPAQLADQGSSKP